MTTLKAVIGANYGDEGKGKVTDYLAYNAIPKCIVVCTNGGAQRGHTVCTRENGNHIFRHFGSGTFAGADTFLPSQFIVNPIIFMQEYKELEKKNHTNVYMSENCLCSTPYDMMINQIIEESRGINKHGSCGMGIWETILRKQATIGDLIKMSNEQIFTYLKGIRDIYFIERLKKKGIEIPKQWITLYYSEELIWHYIHDFKDMIRNITIAENQILKSYKTVIFENGQGLLLDWNIDKYSTPSHTGSANIRSIVDDIWEKNQYQIEVCYVTRTYYTRHGAGELLNEIFNDINSQELSIRTATESNVWNKNQGIFRYGIINDLDSIIKRTEEDFNNHWKNSNAVLSYAFTHIDENSFIRDKIYNTFKNTKKKIYLGIGPYRNEMMINEYEKSS